VAFDTPSLKGRALRLLSGREHSRVELERKLQRFEEEPGALCKVLDDLQAKGFISEARVIESVLNRRAAKLGGARIRQELQGKGLDAQAIAKALAELQPSERERATEVWRKKFGQLPVDAKAYAQQVRFLMARGFSTEVVLRIVRQADD
jgi:regulatory protein